MRWSSLKRGAGDLGGGEQDQAEDRGADHPRRRGHQAHLDRIADQEDRGEHQRDAAEPDQQPPGDPALEQAAERFRRPRRVVILVGRFRVGRSAVSISGAASIGSGVGLGEPGQTRASPGSIDFCAGAAADSPRPALCSTIRPVASASASSRARRAFTPLNCANSDHDRDDQQENQQYHPYLPKACGGGCLREIVRSDARQRHRGHIPGPGLPRPRKRAPGLVRMTEPPLRQRQRVER